MVKLILSDILEARGRVVSSSDIISVSFQYGDRLTNRNIVFKHQWSIISKNDNFDKENSKSVYIYTYSKFISSETKK